MPIDRRTTSGAAPDFTLAASSSWLWVVDAATGDERLVAEAAEVDDLGEALRRGGRREGLGGLGVALLEVRVVQGVHQVVGGLAPHDRGRERASKWL